MTVALGRAKDAGAGRPAGRGLAALAPLLLTLVACRAAQPIGPAPGRAAEKSVPGDLLPGAAVHAFDHLGALGEQAEAAAASGATVIYASGLGSEGYLGLPPAAEFARRESAAAAYVRRSKALGIRRVLGYLCATSLVGLEGFDGNWTPEFRARFATPPRDWLQQDSAGRPLPSWYGGEYRPACMNNPDWRAYERDLVGRTLEAGYDGVFFDNPTIHPLGCYCPHCMAKFAAFLERAGVPVLDRSLEALRAKAAAEPADFFRFRATTARDFLAEMRAHARALRPDAWVTANNSLNAPGRLYSQVRKHGLSIFEMSRAEDLVVVEDMESQPRTLDDGTTREYGPTYKQLLAVGHGKPLVAVTLAEADYHSSPNLMRLAMAEAAANGAAYMLWTTWPEEVRGRLAAAARSQADFERRNAALLRGATPRADAVLFLPFRRFVETETAAVSALAAALTAENVSYEVLSEEDLSLERLGAARALIVENRVVFNNREERLAAAFEAAGGTVVPGDAPDWPEKLRRAVGPPSLVLGSGFPRVRAVLNDLPGRVVIHLLNLDIRRRSSFEDDVRPALEVPVAVRTPFRRVRAVRALTADAGTTRGPLAFRVRGEARGAVVETTLPRLEIAALLVIEGRAP